MRRNQKGVSLIEVLVTVLVLGVGLLGVAALQLTSLNTNQEGYYRSQATSIAESLASKMRASKLAIYDGTTTLGQVLNAYDSGGGAYACAAAVTSCVTGTCTSAEMAAYDRWDVCTQATQQLPDGEVFVGRSNIRARIAVAWTPAAARNDLGQNLIRNVRCDALGVPATKDCVILEMVP